MLNILTNPLDKPFENLVINEEKRRTNYSPKIICPSTATIIHRARLFNILDESRKNAKIIWIAAPGGSGKTTLVSSYLEKNNISHCWYQIDEDDKDLATFFHYLGLAGKLASPRRKKAAPKLTPEYQQGIPAFTRHFFKDITSRLNNNGLIVLDNFQLLAETDSIPSLLPIIIDSLATGVSLVIISRHLPPSSMTTYIAKRQLNVIDAKQIRFTENEWLAAGKLFNSKYSKVNQLSLHHKLDGWIAGLILLPNSENIFDDQNTSYLEIERLNSYITEQFLDSLNFQTSQLLMKVCYMPHITVSAAQVVSQISQAKYLLIELAQKNLFVLRQGEKGYTLHPLVREYLKQRAKKSLTKQELHKLRLTTAEALLLDNEFEASADLLLELKSWKELSTVVRDYAADLLDSGRIESLQHYLCALPQEFTEHDPWINYWKAKVSTYKDIIIALDFYDKAYSDFLEKADIKGIYLTWYSAVSTICNTLLGGNSLVTWINRYSEFSIHFPEPPKILQKELIDALLLQAYYCSGLDPTKRESLQTLIADKIYDISDPKIRLKMISNYIHVTVLSGIKEKDKIIIKSFDSHLDDVKEDPILYLGALTFCSLSSGSFNDFDKVLNLEWRALEIARESGISVFNCHIYAKIIMAALGLNKLDLAKEYISIMEKNIQQKDQVYQSLYFMCMIAMGTYLNNSDKLDKSAKHYFNILENIQFPPFTLHIKLFYIYYLCTQQKRKPALALHDDLLKQVTKLAFPGQSSRFYMIYAKFYFDNNEFDRCDDYLIKSFATARRNKLITYSNWHPELMTWACQRAILQGIEIDYVLHFVEIHYPNLPHPEPKMLNNQWPWPFRVYTFGGFGLKRKNQTIYPKQRSGKSVELLKILVKAQGRNLSSFTIKEKLYGANEHEKASQSLDTQIHRLRKFLGNEQSILRQGEKVALNLKYFWFDTQEFDTLVKQTITKENASKIANQLQGLYQGEYLPENEEIDIIAHRERFRNMYLATLFKCLDLMETEIDRAIEYCQHALVLEPLSEPLYRKLISIYLRHHNRDMAEATLEQCRKLMKQHIGSDLSNDTLSLLNPIQQSDYT